MLTTTEVFGLGVCSCLNGVPCYAPVCAQYVSAQSALLSIRPSLACCCLQVAVKVIDKKKARTDSYVSKNMRREARLLQSQHHPNIIQLYEIIETDNSYYLVTELCTGGDMMQHIYKHQYLEEKEVRKYVRQIVSAVDYLHKGNIIHR